MDQYVGNLEVKPSPLVIIELSGEQDRGTVVPHTVAVPFVLERYGTRLRLSVSPDLEVNTLAQYDNSSHSLGSDLRLRWSPRPNPDLFVTYTHNIDASLPDRRCQS